MKDLSTGSKVKELQAMLFPIQPVPGKFNPCVNIYNITSRNKKCLQINSKILFNEFLRKQEIYLKFKSKKYKKKYILRNMYTKENFKE